MRFLALVAILSSCGPSEPPHGPQRAADATVAVSALREAGFADAKREATAILARDPKSSTAAAVRAIARYELAVDKSIAQLGEILGKAESFKFFDHERGRAAWQELLGELEAIDADLGIVAADPAFSLELCIACWKHDWNRNGRIDERDAKMLELEFDGKGGELAEGDPRRRPTIRFDRGDAMWARSMLAFQRAAVELVLAYRWSELDKLFLGEGEHRIVIKLIDGGRVKRARDLVIGGLVYAELTRQAYLAETDDDHEWVPNPSQKSYAMPLEVDAKLYETWGAVIGDVHRLLASQEGISMREAASLFGGARSGQLVPNAFVDLGRMLREPTDIVVDLRDDQESAQSIEIIARGLLGNGYSTQPMRASRLVARLRHMSEELDRGEDTLERKLRYLIWLN